MYFLRKYKNRMIVTIVIVILIFIIGKTNSDRLEISRFEKGVGDIISPINKASSSLGKRVSDFFIVIKNLSYLLEENEALKIELAKLEERNRDLENVLGKSDFLKKEIQLLESTNHNMIPAEIIGKEPGNWFQTFTIDKGLKDGIKKGSTIVQAIEVEKGIIIEGVVGRVSDVGNNWSKVISIIDELNKVSFKIIRTQDGGIITGDVDFSLSGYLFNSKADVIVGDKLYTSGLGGIFAKDIYIGEVEDIMEREEELMKRIKIKPAVDFKKLYKVMVILD